MISGDPSFLYVSVCTSVDKCEITSARKSGVSVGVHSHSRCAIVSISTSEKTTFCDTMSLPSRLSSGHSHTNHPVLFKFIPMWIPSYLLGSPFDLLVLFVAQHLHPNLLIRCCGNCFPVICSQRDRVSCPCILDEDVTRLGTSAL